MGGKASQIKKTFRASVHNTSQIAKRKELNSNPLRE